MLFCVLEFNFYLKDLQLRLPYISRCKIVIIFNKIYKYVETKYKI